MPKGRRDLRTLAIPEDRIELTDPLFEELVAAGKAERFGVEEPGGRVRAQRRPASSPLHLFGSGWTVCERRSRVTPPRTA